jgi:cytochrome c oxidase cbb3-type subunit 3
MKYMKAILSKTQVVTGLILISNMSIYAQSTLEAASDTMGAEHSSSNNATGWGLIILLLIQILVLRSISMAIKSLSQSDVFPKKSNHLSSIWLIFGMLLSFQTFAQNTNNAEHDSIINFSDTDIYVLIALNVLLSVMVLWMYGKFREVLMYAGLIKQEENKPVFGNIEHWLTRAVPVEKEATIQFEHEYDGIRELDNVLPPWWLWMFYATIAFSFIYLIHYHISPIKALEKIGFVGPGVGQEELYKIEMQEAEKQKQAYLAKAASKINEENVVALTDANEIAQGKEIFQTNCIICHGKEGQGGAGPNLTDDYWLHGGGIKNIFKTIKYGVPEKGMIAWESQLSPKQIQQVASFILTLRGTHPPGAKEPQGELWKEESEDNKTDSLNTSKNNNTTSAK